MKINKIIKKILVLYGLSISLVIASLIEDDSSKNTLYIQNQKPGDKSEDWRFEEDFEKTINTKYSLNRHFSIKPIFDSDIQDINLSGYKDGVYTLSLSIKGNVKCSSTFRREFGDVILQSFFQVIETNKFSRFLKYFYDNGYLSNYIINVIFEKMTKRGVMIKDFRIPSIDDIQNFIQDLSQRLTKDYTEVSFKNLFNQRLEEIKDPTHQQIFIEAVIFDLKENNPFFANLIIELAQRVTDSTLPQYSQIKLIQSDFEMNHSTEIDFKKRYLQALKTLYSIPVSLRSAEIKTHMILLIKSIYNNGQITSDPLPLALQNFHSLHSSNFDDIVNILLLLSEQNQKIKKLEKKFSHLSIAEI